jgi:glycosyltransferase involved in cell wall biosynthesis
MKNILIMYDFFSEQGGIERVMYFQAKTLMEQGYNVSFAFAYVDEKLKKDRLGDFEVIEYGKLVFLRDETLQICSSIIRSEIVNKFKDFDLIICHSFPSSYLALRIKKKYKIPYIVQLHHPPQFLYNVDINWAKNSFKRLFSYSIGRIFGGILRSFDKYCLINANDYFVAGKSVGRVIKQTYGLNGTVLYPPVDRRFKIVKCNLRDLKKYNLNRDFIFGSGRIIKQKRFDYLIEAFSKLKKENLQLVLAGRYDLKEKSNLEDLAKKLKVNVLFLGAVEMNDLIKFYNLAKVTVLTCPKEWFGLVPVESISCGCPVVAWADNFGPQETVIDGKTGFLAKPYLIDDMANKINFAINKKWNKKYLSNSIKKFSEKEQSKVLINLVNRVLSPGS